MKDSWKVKKLKDVIAIQNGYAFDSKKFHDSDGMQLIRIRDLKDGENTVVKYHGEYDEKYIVSKGDLLIGMDGEFRCYEWEGTDSLLNQRVCRLEDFDKSQLEPRFLLYGINKFLKEIEDQTSYTTVKHISARQIKNIEFPIAPLPEQKQIVSILDKAFAAIDHAKANIEKNIQNAEELFQSKLNDVFSQKGEGPANGVDKWEESKLEDLCQEGRIITYGVIKLGEYDPNGVPCLRTSNVRWLKIDLKGLKRINTGLSSSYSRTILEGGEVLVNVRGTLGGVAKVPEQYKGWNISREVACVPIDNQKLDPDFLAYFIGSSLSQAWLGGVKKGAAYIGINLEDLRKLPVSYPNIDNQKRLNRLIQAYQLSSQDYIKVATSKLNLLGELKKSILQKAFSGELTSDTIIEQIEATA